MGEPLRIFISHNASKRPKTAEFLTELDTTLKDQRGGDGERMFMPFVDRDLEPGAPWRGVLYNWMSVCDIAIILLDEQTEHSQWVPREATIFVWRQYLDPTFKVIPILLDGISKEILFKPPFQDLGLNDSGFLECTQGAKVVEALRAEPQPKNNHRLTQLEGLIGTIEPSVLRTFVTNSHELLDLEPSPFTAGLRTTRAIAANLLSYGFRKGPFKGTINTYPSAKALRILAMSGGDRGRVREIGEKIRFYWVDPLASVKLLNARKWRDREVKVIAIRMNIERPPWPEQVIHDYFAQAYSQDRLNLCDLVRVEPLSMQTGCLPQSEELMDRVRLAVWRKYVHESEKDTPPSDNTWMAEYLQDREGEVYCWFVQSDPVKIDQVVEIQSKFPFLRMVYLCFNDSCLGRGDVEYLEPELVEKLEKAASQEIHTSTTYYSAV